MLSESRRRCFRGGCPNQESLDEHASGEQMAGSTARVTFPGSIGGPPLISPTRRWKVVDSVPGIAIARSSADRPLPLHLTVDLSRLVV